MEGGREGVCAASARLLLARALQRTLRQQERHADDPADPTDDVHRVKQTRQHVTEEVERHLRKGRAASSLGSLNHNTLLVGRHGGNAFSLGLRTWRREQLKSFTPNLRPGCLIHPRRLADPAWTKYEQAIR